MCVCMHACVCVYVYACVCVHACVYVLLFGHNRNPICFLHSESVQHHWVFIHSRCFLCILSNSKCRDSVHSSLSGTMSVVRFCRFKQTINNDSALLKDNEC